MKTDLAKKWNSAAKMYACMAADREADAYEYDVNVRSILNLIPGDGKSLLDVGTGGGDFIPKLEDRFENIEGSDVSPNMLEIARERFPNHLFYLWDLEEPFPENKKYDVIICKLVLMFVENLDNVANEFKKTLNPNGVAIISVVHPIYWYTNFLLNQHKIKFHPEFEVMDSGYYSTGRKIIETFDGNKDIQIGFIHRTISDYINPFSKVGLQVTEIDEPQITTTFVKSNPRFADRLHVPFRLNFRVNKL